MQIRFRNRSRSGASLGAAVFATAFGLLFAGVPLAFLLSGEATGPIMIVPAIFILIGLLVPIAAWRAWWKRRGGAISALGDEDNQWLEIPRDTGPVTLSPMKRRIGKLLGVAVFALIWNGVIGGFLYQGYRQGFQDTIGAIFLGVFGLIGLVLLLGALPYFTMAAFNPRTELTLSSRAVPAGGAFEVAWRIRGAAHRLEHLTIKLIAREEATYTRGTNTYTDRQIVFRTPVAYITALEPQRFQGRERVQIPDTAMHSLEAPHNKVLWRLVVRGQIPRWPDVSDEYPLTVLPQAHARNRHGASS